MNKDGFYFKVRTLYKEYNGSEEEIDIALIKKHIYKFRPYGEDFLVIAPSEPIYGSRYLQMAPSKKDELLEVETRLYLSNSEDDFKHYKKSFGFSETDLDSIFTLFKDYLNKVIPELINWHDITEEFK
ncbi:MAG: hypothetical protein KIC98_05525 [Clostridioides difficile]|nr:hypothetical protein [Clostridioides sp.]MBS5787348.1 hypothetical protein [Clostridioides difficile]